MFLREEGWIYAVFDLHHSTQASGAVIRTLGQATMESWLQLTRRIREMGDKFT
jgi:hypothetical protein